MPQFWTGAIGAAVFGRRLHLVIIDISDPSAPRRLGGVAGAGSVQDIIVADGLAFMADRLQGLHIVDVKDPTTPVILATVPVPGTAWGVDVDGGFAFVADHSGLQVIDFTEPAVPVHVYSLTTPGTSTGVAVGDGLAWLADIDGGYEVCDVTDPRAPVYIAHHDLPEGVEDLELDGSALYLANRYDGLRIVDISDPAEPVNLSPLGTLGRARRVAFGRKLVHVLTREVGVIMAVRHCSATVGIDPGEETPFDRMVPSLDAIVSVRPNPFNPRTEVVFTTTREDVVDLAIYDLRGRLVRRLLSRSIPVGTHRETWNGRDRHGRESPAGVYFVRLETPTAVRVEKAALVK